MITEAAPHELAFEQGLRNGDFLYKIDGKEVTPGNLFDFFLSVSGEDMRKITVVRNKETIELPVVIFFMDPVGPRLGFRADRDPKTEQFRVTEVAEGSPAQKAGLLPGDILLKQNDFVLNNWKGYYRAILAQKEGEPQVFQIDRAGELTEKTIVPVGAAKAGS